jgi:hypothetical protein
VTSTRGGAHPCPRFYLDRLVARRWNLPPWALDGVDPREVEDELRIMSLEAEAQTPPA